MSTLELLKAKKGLGPIFFLEQQARGFELQKSAPATIPKGANLSSSSPFKGEVRRGMGPEVAEFPPPPAQGSSFPVTGPASVASVAERLSRQ